MGALPAWAIPYKQGADVLNTKSMRISLVLFATFCLGVTVAAIAKDDKPAGKPADSKLDAGAADMEAFMKMNQPGEHHAHLKQFVGTFDADTEMMMVPGAPAQKSKGVQKSEMVLDGRYLQGDYTGEMMGMKFQGMSLMGYDNQKKKYFSAWADTMSTGLMTFDGTCDKAGKVFTFTGEYEDLMTRRKTKARHVTTVVSPDKHTFEWFDTLEDGKEHRVMAITYTRRK